MPKIEDRVQFELNKRQEKIEKQKATLEMEEQAIL